MDGRFLGDYGGWTKAELDAGRRIAARQAAGDDSGMNYDDIPPVPILWRPEMGTVAEAGSSQLRLPPNRAFKVHEPAR